MGWINYCAECKYNWTKDCKPYSQECNQEKGRILVEHKNKLQEKRRSRYLFEASEKTDHLSRRKNFVINIGRLAAQMNEGIICIDYIPETETTPEQARIEYESGEQRIVIIRNDAHYSDIVRNIFAHI